MQKYIPLLLAIWLPLLCHAQQYPLFSHYTINNFGFNPAVAGSTDWAEARLVYRKQWAGLKESPETQVLSAQGRLKKLPIGVGGYAYNDQAGKLKRVGGTAAISFAKKLDSLTTVTVGLGAGFYEVKLNDNFQAETVSDPTLSAAMGGMGFFDLSAGIYIKRKGLFVGLSVPQVLEPNLKFDTPQTESKNELVRHYYGMVGYKFPLNEKIQLEPSALIKYVEKAPTQYEGSLRVFFNDMFWIGGTYRSDKTIAALVGAELSERLLIAYGYDLTTSSINSVSNGSHEITLGYRFGKPKDSDGDGIPDKKDKCPEEPAPDTEDGCPEKDKEDEEDPEKEEEEEEDDKKDSDDLDGDGIRNDIDKCPNIPGVASNQGCPIDDRDKDGIVDHIDKCPDLAGPLATEGCPGEDRDEDGVIDAVDKCPDEPGPKFNGGCPTVRANSGFNPGSNPGNIGGITPGDLLDLDDLAIRNVYFDTNKDFIRKEYFEDLDRLAAFMVKNKEVKVRMEGHADERASWEYNIDLSKRRVEAVMFYLMNRGVDRRQVIAEYFGEDKPADPRHDEANLQLNRRVELELKFQ